MTLLDEKGCKIMGKCSCVLLNAPCGKIPTVNTERDCMVCKPCVNIGNKGCSWVMRGEIKKATTMQPVPTRFEPDAHLPLALVQQCNSATSASCLPHANIKLLYTHVVKIMEPNGHSISNALKYIVIKYYRNAE